MDEAWIVASLKATATGFGVALTGPAGEVAFELTCAASEHRSPFDLGPLHIFYSSSLPFEELEAAGRAVQSQTRRAAAGSDPCRMLESWVKQAPSGG